MGIIGLIAGLGVPGLMAYAKQARLRATARQVVGLVSLARSTAISTREERSVVVDKAQQEIRVESPSGEALEQVVRVPRGMAVQLLIGGNAPAETKFTFRSSGALTGRSVALRLSHGGHERTLTVTAATGAITLE